MSGLIAVTKILDWMLKHGGNFQAQLLACSVSGEQLLPGVRITICLLCPDVTGN